MNDVVRALAISSGILLPVVVLIVIVSIAAVNRGAAAHGGHDIAESAIHLSETAIPAAASKAAKATGPAVDEISVPKILLLGVGLFVVTVLFLMAVSLVQHLG